MRDYGESLKIIIIILFLTIVFIAISFVFYYSFFIKPITKEEAGIIEYSSLLNIENQSKTRLFIILNYNFSQEEINAHQKKNRYIIANDYFLKDTISLGGVNDYSNNEMFQFSGVYGKPEILPNNFLLKILDNSKKIIKQWNYKTFNKNVKLKYNKRLIKVLNINGDFIIQ